jgi:DNA-binding IclR family transcriptional regulator
MPKKVTKDQREYSVPAVDRALDIMEFMSEHSHPHGVTELSRILDIPLNSVFRILKRLTEREYVVQDPQSGGYQLSTRFFTLGMRLYTRFELNQRARPHMEWLCRETEETCQIQIPHGERMLVLDTVSPEVDFYLRVVPGSLVYYHPNAYGKCVMAFTSEEEVLKILPPRLPEMTANTKVLRQDVINQFEGIRKTGIAYDDEEYNNGIQCIGSPVFNIEGEVIAGLGITGLVGTFNKSRVDTFENLVLQCAMRVSRDIGYTGDYFNDKVSVDNLSPDLKK